MPEPSLASTHFWSTSGSLDVPARHADVRLPDPLGLAIAGYAVAAHSTPRSTFITVPSSVIVVALIIVAGAPATGDTLFVGVLLVLNLVAFVPACLLGLLVSAVSRRRRSAELGGIRPTIG